MYPKNTHFKKGDIIMKKTIKLIALTLVLTLSVLTLASCFFPNMDPEKAIDALEENDYLAAEDDTVLPLIFAGLGIKDVDTVVTATAVIDKKGEHVTIIYFEDADAAKAAWEDVKEYAEDKDKKEEDSDWKIGKFGKMIWYGTENAIKATY
jgi:hypothetical protein